MKGNQLKDFVRYHIFGNPYMNLRLLVGSTEIDSYKALEDQEITEASVVQVIVQLASGLLRKLGGKRKTQRRRRY
jgi:hypothetical protein